MPLHSQQMRAIAPEIDSLRLGCGWTVEDLSKPHVLIETVGGDSHPCSVHLIRLADVVREGVIEGGGVSGRYHCTDLCDGILQGTDAMDLSLPSREVIALATEMHARGGHFDGLALLSGCDKSLPAHLLAAARLDMPTIVLPAGVMDPGPASPALRLPNMSLEQVGTIASQLRRGEVTEEEYQFLRLHACPSLGSCAFLGTASTMQILSEALGLALPGSAMRPPHLTAMERGAREAGILVLRLIEKGLSARSILSQKALENAIIVHAAIGGSTNAMLHLPALAYAAGLNFDRERTQQLNDQTPYLVNVRPGGEHTTTALWYAGGAYRIMWELRERLHLDTMTVSGHTLGENLERLEKTGWFEHQARYLANFGLRREEIIRPLSQPLAPQGALAFLQGNLAPEGAVIKRTAVDPSMGRFVGRARCFDRQEDAIEAVYGGRVSPGDALIIRYEGPRASGMPEQFYVTEAIASSPELSKGVALITDGRFSGASRGPAVGHVSPEAAVGGPIAVLEDDDLILVDISERRLEVVGIAGKELPAEEVEATLRGRLSHWQPPPPRRDLALLGIYAQLALSAAEGGGMKY